MGKPWGRVLWNGTVVVAAFSLVLFVLNLPLIKGDRLAGTLVLPGGLSAALSCLLVWDLVSRTSRAPCLAYTTSSGPVSTCLCGAACRLSDRALVLLAESPQGGSFH